MWAPILEHLNPYKNFHVDKEVPAVHIPREVFGNARVVDLFPEISPFRRKVARYKARAHISLYRLLYAAHERAKNRKRA